jgi:hypothetical protein
MPRLVQRRRARSGALLESWPVDGIRSSFYGRHKADVERLLDVFERERPDIRVVRMRPGLVSARGGLALSLADPAPSGLRLGMLLPAVGRTGPAGLEPATPGFGDRCSAS